MGIEVRAALLRVKIRNSDSENRRSTCFDWHNFIRPCIKYEILLQILFFGLTLFFKFLILTCLFKKISASLCYMSCNFFKVCRQRRKTFLLLCCLFFLVYFFFCFFYFFPTICVLQFLCHFSSDLSHIWPVGR